MCAAQALISVVCLCPRWRRSSPKGPYTAASGTRWGKRSCSGASHRRSISPLGVGRARGVRFGAFSGSHHKRVLWRFPHASGRGSAAAGGRLWVQTKRQTPPIRSPFAHVGRLRSAAPQHIVKRAKMGVNHTFASHLANSMGKEMDGGARTIHAGCTHARPGLGGITGGR